MMTYRIPCMHGDCRGVAILTGVNSWITRCAICERLAIPIRDTREEAYIRWLETASSLLPFVFIINEEVHNDHLVIP